MMVWNFNFDIFFDVRFIMLLVGLFFVVIIMGIIFNVFLVLFVGIRMYVCWIDCVFGLDDGLMVVGVVCVYFFFLEF